MFIIIWIAMNNVLYLSCATQSCTRSFYLLIQLSKMRKFTQKTKQRIADRKAAILNRFNEHVASGLCKCEADDIVAEEFLISPTTVRRIRLYPKEPGTVSVPKSSTKQTK